MEANNNGLFTRLLLIRHGQTLHNTQGRISGRSDIPINEIGHQQARSMAERVKAQYPIDVIYASPLQRTMQTAEYLAQAFDLPIIPNQDLIEYGFGDLSDIKASVLKDTNPALYEQVVAWFEADFSESPIRPDIPGSEPIEELKKRIQAFTDLILEKHPGKQVAAVSHGGFIKSFLYYHTGGDFSRYVPFWVDNVSLTIVDFYKRNPMIRLFNDNSHIHEELEYGRPRLL
jgi:probable phosphoglycerate mutase